MIPALFASSFVAGLLLVGALRVHGALAWLVAAPFAFLLRDRVRWTHTILFGAVFADVVGIAAHTSWLSATAERYFDATREQADAAALLLILPTGVVHGAVLALGMRAALRLPSPWRVCAGGAMWAAWDWLIPQIFPYYAWAPLAAVQTDFPPALRSAFFLGQPGLTFAVAAAGLSLGLAASRSPRRGRDAVAGISLVALVLFLGAAAQRAVPSPRESALCTVEAIDAESRDAPSSLESYDAASRDAAAQWSEPPSVLVWPESALPSSPEVDAPLRRRLVSLTAQLGTVLIAGGPGTSWDEQWRERRWNSAFRLGVDGSLQRYDKRRLVPFAEYWPWPAIAAPAWMTTSYVEPGSRAALFRAGSCALGVLICFEAQRPELARELAAAGADALVVLSNDADLPSQAIALEVDQVRLRSAETGLPVLRLANAGQSVVAGETATLLAARHGAFRVAIDPPSRAPALVAAPMILAACLLASGSVLLWALATSRRPPTS